jgi:hypothetical protein
MTAATLTALATTRHLMRRALAEIAHRAGRPFANDRTSCRACQTPPLSCKAMVRNPPNHKKALSCFFNGDLRIPPSLTLDPSLLRYKSWRTQNQRKWKNQQFKLVFSTRSLFKITDITQHHGFDFLHFIIVFLVPVYIR